MKASRREIALLWRIKDLFTWAVIAHKILSKLDKTIVAEIISPDERDSLHHAVLWGSRALAIEEGKQNSDYENWGIALKNLGVVREGRKRKVIPESGKEEN